MAGRARYGLAAVLALGLAGLSPAAEKPAEAKPEVAALPEVVVTALRSETALAEVPAAVQVVDRYAL